MLTDKIYIATDIMADNTGDPWRDVTVSADGQHIKSTTSQPIYVSDGFHCSDLGTAAARVDPTIARVQSQALSYMKTWLAEWKSSSNNNIVRRSPNLIHRARGIAKSTSVLSGWSMTPEIQVLSAKPLTAWSRGSGTI